MHLILDVAANSIMNDVIVDRQRHLFRETDSMCPVCQHDLEIRYCENGTYALRCSVCDFLAITRASCPNEAAEKVGLNVKPVRHGQWVLVARTYTEHGLYRYTTSELYRCSECGLTAARKYPYCHCGAKMDSEVTNG